ncbi:translocation/assembly module TamB domain-containing protein [Fodinibius sp. Rm-B-1B1-1]|uniref:translocation/assembly module TamB domain-containing protein n=1 Tax=Fodinibius alkaliphilus TaxID=3140241 RepID=UPI00315AD31A
MSEQNNQHSGFKKWGMRFLWVFFAVLVLGLVLRLSLKTEFVQNYARTFIVDMANSQLNADFSIERLSGDLWKEVTLSGIALQQQDTIATIDSIHTRYNVLTLLGGEIEVSELQVYRPHVNLRQHEGHWNVEGLVVESSDTTASPMMKFQVQDFGLNEGNVSVESDSLPIGSHYTIDQLDVASSFGFDGNDYNLELRDLAFYINETNIDQGIAFQASAAAKEQRVTLEQLMLATGKSVVEADGFASVSDTSIQFDIQSNPIYWQDIRAIMDEYPLREDVSVSLSMQGNPEQFTLSLAMQAEGLEAFSLESRFAWPSEFIVQEVTASASKVDLATLLADSTYPRLDQFNLTFDGQVNLGDLDNSAGKMSFSAKEIIYEPYRLQQLSGNANMENKSIALGLTATEGQQHVTADIKAANIWVDNPKLKTNITGENINPGYWVQDTTYNGKLNFKVEASGPGWYPAQQPWDYSLEMEEGGMLGYQLSNARVKGQVSSNTFSADGQMKIRDSFIEMVASLQGLDDLPSYTYQLKTENFNLGMFLEQQNFSTAINGQFKGRGTGFDPANMQLQSSVEVDSSIINGELLDTISADFGIRDGVAKVDSARLQSGISDGAFSLRLNMLDLYDEQNELFLDLDVKDLSVLAPLAYVDTLRAEGNITGTLRPIDNQDLHFLGNVDLSNVAYNTLFMTDRAKGSVDIHLSDTLSYHTDVELEQPSFSGVPLQNLQIQTQGSYLDSTARGQYNFQLSSATEGRIEQSGDYDIAPDAISINTNELNFISDYRTLTLEESFGLEYQNERLQLDTLRISSGDGAFLEMGIPTLSADEQQGFVKGQGLNVSVIQSSFFGNTYFDGVLSGQFNIDRKGTDLQASGHALLSEVSFQGGGFDSLLVSASVAEERLEGTLSLKDQGEELMSGDANLPFKLGDPQEFEEAFFNEPISGDLRVWDISIERFNSLFDEAIETETQGILSFWGTLGGTAGDPEFDADVSLKNAVLSGVAIDSITAGANYRHVDEVLSMDATVMSLNQPAAEINAQFPLFIDMKTFEVGLPEQKDRIAIDIETNDFDLRAINDFVDPLLLRDVRGRLNGNVQVKGTMDDLKTDGNLSLNKGRFRLVPAGITIDNINSEITFTPDQLRLSRLVAQSGNGTFNANGTVALEQLVPGDMNINMRAKSFRVANTSQYNAVINLDAQTKGSLTNPRVTGSLDVLRGFVKLDNFGEKSVETVRLDTLEEVGPSVSVYDSLALDMDIGFNERFFIQNERYLEMEVELAGELDLAKKSGEDLQLFGSMNAASGYARPFGKEFDIEEGVVTFSGNPENPQVNIRSRYEPPQTQEEIVIWYIIEGTVEDPKFRYESQPPMELENIISYTLFGQPFYALDSWKQVVASSGSNTTAADVALDVLLDRVEALATRQLGIDVVKIDNTRAGGETGTSITTGWYLNPKVFFAIQNVITGSTPETGFLLEYMLRKDLKLILRQGNNIRQGVDLRWNYDY